MRSSLCRVSLFLVVGLSAIVASAEEMKASQNPEMKASQAPETMTMQAPEEHRFLQESSFRLIYLTSRPGKELDYRNLRNLSSDETGSMSESIVLPNLNYMTALGVVPVTKNHRLFFIGLQSLDSKADRTVVTPFMDFEIPGSIAALGYKYKLDNGFYADAKSIYVQGFGVLDPYFGVGYENRQHMGWSQRASLQGSVPTTTSSRAEELATRATARAGVSYGTMKWRMDGGVAQTQSFYQHGSRRVPELTPEQLSMMMKMMMSRPDPLDLVLTEKELQRTSAALGASYFVNESLRLGTGVSVARAYTDKKTEIWMNSVRVVNVAYAYDRFEVGGDISVISDVRDYDAIKAPQLWTAGVRAGYVFGNQRASY